MSERPGARMSVAAMAALIALLSIGCSQAPSNESPSSEATAGQGEATGEAKSPIEKAREAGLMAVEIEKEPNRLTAILEAHNMTSEEFEALMFEIAQDPELTEAYEVARTGS